MISTNHPPWGFSGFLHPHFSRFHFQSFSFLFFFIFFIFDFSHSTPVTTGPSYPPTERRHRFRGGHRVCPPPWPFAPDAAVYPVLAGRLDRYAVAG